jgi:hypothetical protein
MRLITGERLLDFLNAQRHRGGRCGVLSRNQPPQAGMPHDWRLLPADPVGYAHDLYAALRDMDHAGVDLIVVEALTGSAAWAAVGRPPAPGRCRRRPELKDAYSTSSFSSLAAQMKSFSDRPPIACVQYSTRTSL